ncbi:MAG: cation:proton antiporter, partial [Cytophagaceae bacterium]
MKENFLLEFIIYLSAALVFVPLAKKLGLGSVLGYLLAGIMIGPFVIGFIGQEGKDLMHFAEFGVVMMLFLIGLELEPLKLWKIRNQIVGVGLSQVILTTALFFAGGLLLNMNWQSALAIGMALSMSSTALVLQSMKEKGLMNTVAGEGSFAVLLFQDISVIPILAILPLLVFLPVATAGEAGHSLIDDLPGWLKSITILGAVMA